MDKGSFRWQAQHPAAQLKFVTFDRQSYRSLKTAGEHAAQQDHLRYVTRPFRELSKANKKAAKALWAAAEAQRKAEDICMATGQSIQSMSDSAVAHSQASLQAITVPKCSATSARKQSRMRALKFPLLARNRSHGSRQGRVVLPLRRPAMSQRPPNCSTGQNSALVETDPDRDPGRRPRRTKRLPTYLADDELY